VYQVVKAEEFKKLHPALAHLKPEVAWQAPIALYAALIGQLETRRHAIASNLVCRIAETEAEDREEDCFIARRRW
jgi:hypothetical protein